MYLCFKICIDVSDPAFASGRLKYMSYNIA